MKRFRRMLGALIATAALVAGLLAVTAGTASADYGTGAQYQVEISSNPPGFGFWIWAELGPGQTSDYQETDCIHLGGGHATDAAAHDAGSVSSWNVANGTLTMNGVKIIGGLATANISVSVPLGGFGHSSGMTLTVTQEVAPFFPLNVPLSLPAQVQLAP